MFVPPFQFPTHWKAFNALSLMPFLNSLLGQEGRGGGGLAPLLGLITTKDLTLHRALCFRFRAVTLTAVLKSQHYCFPGKDEETSLRLNTV